ncbi:MAG: alginate export family protein [Haliscomenobacter sp.]|nr:alginate export family protein [Haliscomenobacter sp.]MBK9491220.1 alginate export family protein [Haliscomenobacter sp.]
MKKHLVTLLLFVQVAVLAKAQNSTETAHSILPADGIIQYLPKDTSAAATPAILSTNKLQFTPQVNFFFLPEGTLNYKEAGLAVDTGHLNFYLRGDFGAKLSLPKNVDMVFSLQSYGVYTRSLGPLDPNLKLYEGYVDLKKLDKNGRLALRFGRMSLGKYGSEILVGDDDFTKGRSFESVRLRYKRKRVTSDLMWVQLYQPAPAAADFEWNHPIFLATFNTFNFSRAINFDANLPFIIDQYNSGLRTTVFMPDVRAFGQLGNFRYSAEFILQTGTAKGILNENITGTVNAYATELSAGYTSTDGKLSAQLAYYRASGDDNPGDTELKSYNVLWQNEHRRFGYVDAFKGSNVQATTLHLDWKLGRLVSTGVHGVFAQVLESKDRSAGIATLGSLNELATTSKSIGMGGDWYLNYYYNHNLNFQFSTSAFRAGEYFTAVNGVDKTMIRMYLMMALRI